MVKRLGYGVYEAEGFVIDVLNLTDSECEEKRKSMSRDDFIRFMVAMDLAGDQAIRDGLIECEYFVDSPVDDDLIRNLYVCARQAYDSEESLRNGGAVEFE